MTRWHQLASIKWPIAFKEGRVFGSGPYAILVPATQSVLLYETEVKRHRGINAVDHEYKLFTLKE
jgi:hypothetical protein